MGMKGTQMYVNHGSKRVGEVLPGVKIHVLGPPTLTAVTRHRASSGTRTRTSSGTFRPRRRGASPLRAVPLPTRRARYRQHLPVETRWFLPRIEAVRGDQLLEIVRILDKQMNNTSVILLFEVGAKKLLFPGDAQLENWMYALKEAEGSQRRGSCCRGGRLQGGHHGSLNATPKTLWNLFRGKDQHEGTGCRR